jgi:hypothetical protein
MVTEQSGVPSIALLGEFMAGLKRGCSLFFYCQ